MFSPCFCELLVYVDTDRCLGSFLDHQRPVTKETVAPAQIWNSREGGKHKQEERCGSAVLGKLRPSRLGTAIAGSLTLLALTSGTGLRAGTLFKDYSFSPDEIAYSGRAYPILRLSPERLSHFTSDYLFLPRNVECHILFTNKRPAENIKILSVCS